MRTPDDVLSVNTYATEVLGHGHTIISLSHVLVI